MNLAQLPRRPQPSVKIASAAAHFHGFGVALAGSWDTGVKIRSSTDLLLCGLG
jgi:hypothetical protein